MSEQSTRNDNRSGVKGGPGLTRESIVDGSFLKAVRTAAAYGGAALEIRTDAQIEALVAAFLAARPKTIDTWIFAYGSLMWNPTFHYSERCQATLPNWHRSFCLWNPLGRGTPKHPCLTLALEDGGQTDGVAFRFPPGQERVELELCFRREMFSTAYRARWVSIETVTGPRDAVAFVANHDFTGYAGRLTDHEIATAIASARGSGGSCADYLWQTLGQLQQLGLEDEPLKEIGRLVQAQIAGRISATTATSS
jgi:cation transport protein ChaC